MVKFPELLQVFGVIWRVLCELVLAEAVGVTCKICLKLAGVRKRLWRPLGCCCLFVCLFTRPDFDTAVELFQEPVRKLE